MQCRRRDDQQRRPSRQQASRHCRPKQQHREPPQHGRLRRSRLEPDSPAALSGVTVGSETHAGWRRLKRKPARVPITPEAAVSSTRLYRSLGYGARGSGFFLYRSSAHSDRVPRTSADSAAARQRPVNTGATHAAPRAQEPVPSAIVRVHQRVPAPAGQITPARSRRLGVCAQIPAALTALQARLRCLAAAPGARVV
jgi:hypothetical protein